MKSNWLIVKALIFILVAEIFIVHERNIVIFLMKTDDFRLETAFSFFICFKFIFLGFRRQLQLILNKWLDLFCLTDLVLDIFYVLVL